MQPVNRVWFSEDGLSEDFWVLKPVGLSLKRKTPGAAENPVKESGGQIAVPHDLCPVLDVLVGGEHDRAAAIGTADEVVKRIRLGTGNGRVADLVDDHKVSLPDVPHTETGHPIGRLVIEKTGEVGHPFECDSVALVDSQNSEADSEHGLPKAGGRAKMMFPWESSQLRSSS